MKLLKFYPGQKITVNELKWQQQEYCNALNDIYSILNPTFFASSGHGLLLHKQKGSDFWNSDFPYVFSGVNDSTTVNVKIYKPYLHCTTFGTYNFSDIFQFVSMMMQDESELSATTTINWVDSLINSESSATNGWLNFFFVPVYYGYSSPAIIDKYLDSVISNQGALDSTLSQTVYTADGQQIIPYLVDGPINASESPKTFSSFVKVYKSSGVFGANDFATSFTYWTVQDHHGDASSPIVVPYKNLVTYLYSVYWNASLKTYSSGGYYKVIYQPIVAAQMIEYDDSLESVIETHANTLQGAFDKLQTIFSRYQSSLENIESDILAGGYENASFVTNNSGSNLLSGYTEDTSFPSAIGKRFDA